MKTRSGSRRAWTRRALSLLLAAVMVLGFLPGFPGAENSEAEAQWAEPYLNQLVEWGFIRADQANNPNLALTRADFMAIVNRAYGYSTPGETPFEDVEPNQWFYDDVGIAYNARYIVGTSPTTASPNDPLTRETAATVLGRNMMLQESPGEIVEFTDARQISNWAMGTVKSSLEHYLISGYTDGTLRPKRNVSWGEMAAMVTSLVGTPLQEAGDYTLGGVFGNVTITSSNVTLRDSAVSGDAYVTGGVGLGNVKMENVDVLGRIIASGTGRSEAGEASILLRNVTADELLIDNLQDNYVSVQADGITAITRTTVRTSAYIEDNTPDGMGLKYISIEGDVYPEGEEPEGWEPIQVDLAGRIGEVVNRTPGSQVRVGKGTVEKLTVDEAATDSTVIIDRGATVKELNLDTATTVTGEGDIGHLVVNAPGCVIDIMPDEITIRPGITAIICGQEMDSVAAEEFSMEPMILAGYPEARDITPTGLEGVFMTNKAGTIYYAVSAITDGSVGADDLIKPPSYGSIAVSGGSVKVSQGNEEVTAAISGLTPGGSYYLSAVLEDAKGNRSPVKVISFTTPDDSIPAFCDGYPHMSKVSPKDSVVVTMTTKDCKLYYALLPQGAAAPTEAEMRANAVAGALGYGVRDAYKNVEDVFRVNDQLLEEQTTYVLYFFLMDADGVNKSGIISITFRTDDETPPIFVVEPTVTKISETSVELTFQLNEDGTVYWVAIPSNTMSYPKPEPGTDYEIAPPNSMYGKLQIANGMNIGSDGKFGSVVCRAYTNGTIVVSGLEKGKAYDFYYVAKDNAGPDRNYSEIWKKITIHTLDTEGPVFSQSFSDSSSLDGRSDPRANTAIYLDVSEDVRYTGEGGGTSFLELYQAVKDANTEAERNAARNKLAASLYGAIKLHKIDVQTNAEENIGYKWQTSQTGDNWTIDYTQATVEAHEGGIRITFPRSALHLENGGQYYFTISNVTDISNNQNPLVPTVVDFYTNEAASVAGGHDVPVFIVEFARVDFSTPGVDDWPIVPGNEGLSDDDDDKFVRADMSFRLTPVSTETVADNIRYDLLLWTYNYVAFDLYYRVVDERGNKISDSSGNYPETYTYTNPNNPLDTVSVSRSDYLLAHLGPNSRGKSADSNGWISLGSSGEMNPSNGNRSGRSVNGHQNFNNFSANSFPQLNNLNSNLRYEFIIHLTSLDDIPEMENGVAKWRNWNGEVKFYANVAAGQSYNLSNLGGSLTDKNWADWKDKGLGLGAVSIGRNNTREEPIDTQELSKLFTDSRLPSFDGDAPRFTPHSDSVDVDLRFSTSGTLYYLVGKADTGGNHLPEITTTRTLLTDPTLPTKYPEGDTDQSTVDSGGLLAVNGQPGSYYIRMSDVEKDPPNYSLAPTDSGATMQNWMIGGIKDGATIDDPEEENLIVRPLNQYVFNPRGQAETANAINGNFPFQGRTLETLTIEGLDPETDYFIYFVLKGEADTLSHVYIYHFKTPKATKPKIELKNYTVPEHADEYAGASMKTDIESHLQYYVFSRTDAERPEFSILREYVYVSKAFADKNRDMLVYTENSAGAGPDTITKTDSDGKTLYSVTSTDENGNPVYAVEAYDALLNTFLSSYDSNRPSTDDGYSVFDIYASPALKVSMSNFLHGRYWTQYMTTSIQAWEESGGELNMQGTVWRNDELPNCPAGTDFVILTVAHTPGVDENNPSEFESFAGYAPIRAGRATTVSVDDWWSSFQMGKEGDPYYTGQIFIIFKPQLIFNVANKTPVNNNNISRLGIANNTENHVDISVASTDSQQTMLQFSGSWVSGDSIYIPASAMRDINGGVAASSLTIRIEDQDGSGILVSLIWDPPLAKPNEFWPYKASETLSVRFNIDPAHSDRGVINDEKTPPELAVNQDFDTIDIYATVTPSNMAIHQFSWTVESATPPGSVTISDIGTTRATLNVGNTTTSARVAFKVSYTENGSTVEQTFYLDVSPVNTNARAIAATGQLSVPMNGTAKWNMSGTSGATITLQTSAPLGNNVNYAKTTVTSKNGTIVKSGGQVVATNSASGTTVKVPLVLKSAPKSGTTKDTVTIELDNGLTYEFEVEFTGSQSIANQSGVNIGTRPY